jgi:hypothetical protein
MFYALSNSASYWNKKINIFIALAPVASLNHCGNPLINTAARLTDEIRAASDFVGLYQLGQPSIPTKLFGDFCGATPTFCNEL